MEKGQDAEVLRAEGGDSYAGWESYRNKGGLSLLTVFYGPQSEQHLKQFFLDECESLPLLSEGDRATWLLDFTGAVSSPGTLFESLGQIYLVSEGRQLPRVAVVMSNSRYGEIRSLMIASDAFKSGSLEIFFGWGNACRWLRCRPSILVQELGPRFEEAAFARQSVMDRQGAVYHIGGRVGHQATLEAVGRMRDGGKRVVTDFREADLLESLVCGWEDLAEAYAPTRVDSPLRMGILCRREQVPFMEGFAGELRRNRQVPVRVFTDVARCADWVGMGTVDMDETLMILAAGGRDKYNDSFLLNTVDDLKVKRTSGSTPAGLAPSTFEDFFLFDPGQGVLFRYLRGPMDVQSFCIGTAELSAAWAEKGFRGSFLDCRGLEIAHLDEASRSSLGEIIKRYPNECRLCLLVDMESFAQVQHIVGQANGGRVNVATFISPSVACSWMGLDPLLVDFLLAKLRIEAGAD